MAISLRKYSTLVETVRDANGNRLDGAGNKRAVDEARYASSTALFSIVRPVAHVSNR